MVPKMRLAGRGACRRAEVLKPSYTPRVSGPTRLIKAAGGLIKTMNAMLQSYHAMGRKRVSGLCGFILRIQRNDLSFDEVVRFFYKEAPPTNDNYLRCDYAPHIEKVVRPNHQGPDPVFSVIIPTYNRCDLLSEALRGLAEQKNVSKNNFEIIVVDNGSADRTEKAVREFSEKSSTSRVLYIKLKRNYGADFARNVAFLHSKGELLAFTDDDCRVPPDWLYEFKREFDTNPETCGVGGYKIPRSTKERLDQFHRYLMWQHFLLPHVRSKNRNLSENRCGLTANVCYRREFFEKMKGFNAYFKHAGFMEFMIRAHKSGASLLYVPRMVEHYAYLSYRAQIGKFLAQGWDWYLMRLLHPDYKRGNSFAFYLKRCLRIAGDILKKEKMPPLYHKTLSDVSLFLFLTIIANFSMWFGKYWLPIKMAGDAYLASHDVAY